MRAAVARARFACVCVSDGGGGGVVRLGLWWDGARRQRWKEKECKSFRVFRHTIEDKAMIR